jgi:hypothetical protein
LKCKGERKDEDVHKRLTYIQLYINDRDGHRGNQKEEKKPNKIT